MTTDKSKALKSARQAKGILDKVISMIETDAYCPEIIQQADAAIGLIKTGKKALLVGHLDHCLAVRLKAAPESTVAELKKIYNLNN